MSTQEVEDVLNRLCPALQFLPTSGGASGAESSHSRSLPFRRVETRPTIEDRLCWFQAHFALTEQGDLALEGFGEGTKEDVFTFAYPLLEHALDEAARGDGDADDERLAPDRRAAIVCAVE